MLPSIEQAEDFHDLKKSSHFLCDYGFFSEHVGVYAEDSLFIAPSNIVQLAIDNFVRELKVFLLKTQKRYYRQKRSWPNSMTGTLKKRDRFSPGIRGFERVHVVVLAGVGGGCRHCERHSVAISTSRERAKVVIAWGAADKRCAHRPIRIQGTN